MVVFLMQNFRNFKTIFGSNFSSNWYGVVVQSNCLNCQGFESGYSQQYTPFVNL